MTKKRFIVKPKVEYCLEHYHENRNSDKQLIISVWWTFYRNLWKFNEAENEWYLPPHAIINDVPPPESIRRSRQVIQNDEGRFLPDPEVQAERDFKEGEMEAGMARGDHSVIDTIS